MTCLFEFMKKDCLGRDFMTGLEVVSEKIIELKVLEISGKRF